MKTKILTDRQKELYEWLNNHSDRFYHLEEIYNDLREFYPRVTIAKTFTQSGARRRITNDITSLKSNGVIQTIILSTTKGIKLATEEEYVKYLKTEEISLKSRLKVLYKQRRKAKLNNQILLNNDVVAAYIE